MYYYTVYHLSCVDQFYTSSFDLPIATLKCVMSLAIPGVVLSYLQHTRQALLRRVRITRAI